MLEACGAQQVLDDASYRTACERGTQVLRDHDKSVEALIPPSFLKKMACSHCNSASTDLRPECAYRV